MPGFHHPAQLLDPSLLLVVCMNQKSFLEGDNGSGAADNTYWVRTGKHLFGAFGDMVA